MAMISKVLERAPSADAMLRRVAARAKRRGQTVRVDPHPLVAYVNAGRWCADCPQCGAGIAVNPEWTSATCLGEDCHTTYSTLVIPPDWGAIEAQLRSRPERNRNWIPGETTIDLEIENLTRSVIKDGA